LFKVNRPLAVQAAPEIFNIFERYQIVLAGAALLSTAIWRLTTPRKLLTALFFLFAAASVGTIISAAMISPKLHMIRMAGNSSGPDFRKLHGYSMIIYMAEAALLLIGGFVLTAAMRQRAVVAAPATAPLVEPAGQVLSP
jgi:uncharacterized membrane protein YjjP (DUF1212 family)